MINFYPLTAAEQAIFAAINQPSQLIMTQPDDRVGVDADALQDAEFITYLNAITFDAGKITVLDLDEIEALSSAKGQKQRELDSWYEDALSDGYDIGDGFVLSFDDTARYAAMISVIEFGVGKGSKKEDDLRSIRNSKGKSRQFKLKDLVVILDGLCSTFEAIDEILAVLTLKIASTKTMADLNNVKTDFATNRVTLSGEFPLLLASLIAE